MRVNPTQMTNLSPAEPRRVTGGQQAAEAPAPRRQDDVAFSEQFGRLRRAHAAVEEAPDVRAERVAEIKAQVDAGTYQIDTQALAETLLGGM